MVALGPKPHLLECQNDHSRAPAENNPLFLQPFLKKSTTHPALGVVAVIRPYQVRAWGREYITADVYHSPWLRPTCQSKVSIILSAAVLIAAHSAAASRHCTVHLKVERVGWYVDKQTYLVIDIYEGNKPFPVDLTTAP